MVNVDASAGADRYARQTANKPGFCLWECQVHGYQCPASIGPHAGQYPTAYSSWLYSLQRHTDANPPKGAAVYFGPSPTRTDANKNAGDICISLGGGLIRCSDGGGSGRMATMTIAARAKQIARPYLGWASDFLGHQLVDLGPVSGSTGTSALVTAAYALAQLGAAYLAKLQAQLGVAVTSIWDDATIKALQKKVGTLADGKWGKNSNVALQKDTGITQDGKWGPAVTLAIKHAIDSGKWAPVVVPPVYVPPTEAEFKALKASLATALTQVAAVNVQLATASTTVSGQAAKLKAGQTAAEATVKALA